MKVYEGDLIAAEGILLKGEHVEGSATQRRFGPGGSLTSPTTILVTDKRIIVIKRAIFGLRHDHEVFSLSTVTSIKVRHGFISSSIFIRTQGSESGDKGKSDDGRQEGEIFGLTKNAAEGLTNLINHNIAKKEASETSFRQPLPSKHPISHRHDSHSPNEGFEFCSKCGAKVLKTAKFCRSCGAKILQS